jgi:hypothetical protein
LNPPTKEEKRAQRIDILEQNNKVNLGVILKWLLKLDPLQLIDLNFDFTILVDSMDFLVFMFPSSAIMPG